MYPPFTLIPRDHVLTYGNLKYTLHWTINRISCNFQPSVAPPPGHVWTLRMTLEHDPSRRKNLGGGGNPSEDGCGREAYPRRPIERDAAEAPGSH